ncbi:MAG: hypothetical protein II551_04755 [Paludibacteraceae bacterium]|nr:hypothetical protein [Paludibacteraceae bacterium]
MNNVMDKLDYMERLFAALHEKRTEMFVITGIWHRLKRTDVKFVIQQHVDISAHKYALGDLYLPQLNMWIEINESHHKNNEKADYKRNVKIVEKAGGELHCICTYDPDNISINYGIDGLSDQIDKIVALIHQRIEEIGDNFIPWNDQYFPMQKTLSTKDYIAFKSIDKIAKAFNTKIRKRGFLSPGGFDLKGGYAVWTPNTNSATWKNILNLAKDEIEEYKIDKATGSIDIAATKDVFNKEEKRIVFCKYRDFFGNKEYKFIGVFTFKGFDSIGARKWVKETDSIDVTNLI